MHMKWSPSIRLQHVYHCQPVLQGVKGPSFGDDCVSNFHDSSSHPLIPDTDGIAGNRGIDCINALDLHQGMQPDVTFKECLGVKEISFEDADLAVEEADPDGPGSGDGE